MHITKKWFNCRRLLLLLLLFSILISISSFDYLIHRLFRPYVPRVRNRPCKIIPFKKVSVAYYTTIYGERTDSRSPLFNQNLKQICHLLDPEEYRCADGIVVSLVDLVYFPILSKTEGSYRQKYQSQLWLVHTEESPRKSYYSVEINNITDLDDWFNLTATLKPESDLHIQYKGYRIKPEIVNLIQNKLNQTFNHRIQFTPLLQSNLFTNETSIYFNTLASVLNKEFNGRQNDYAHNCPYTCNQPLSPDIINSLQPYLRPIIPRILNRDIVYIAWFVSNCNAHSGREEFVLKLRSQPGIQVDIYGFCSSIFNSHVVPIKCRKETPNCMKKTLSNYRFYLSFENSKCDTYITEKYWNQGLNGEAIPIVLGAKREQYERIAVPNSYIHVDNYRTAEELAKELHRLNKNDSEYVKYLQWTQLYDIKDAYSPMGPYDIPSTLCLLGHYQRLYAMNKDNKQRKYLLQVIHDMYDIRKIRLPNFNWETATTKLIRLSDFYNPKVNCWDNDYPSFAKRVYNFFFIWSKLF